MTTTERTEERTEFLTDIFVTAIETGVNYWANVANYRLGPSTMQVSDVSELTQARAQVRNFAAKDGTPWHQVNLETIETGIDKIKTDKNIEYLSDYFRELVEDAEADLDATNIDSTVADAIVQIGLFGKLVYC